MKKWLVAFLLVIQGCNDSKQEENTLKVGVTAGPHAMIMDQVKDLALKEGLQIQVIEFNDFVLPNNALNDGDLDINSYQHQPFLDDQIKTKGYNLTSVGKTVLMPMGVYSVKLKSLDDLPDQAKIAIPNDPTNGGRALLLLEKAGLIKLKDKKLPSLMDVVENKKGIKLIELEAPQLPRSLTDVDAAVINTDWIVLSDMDPESALLTEGKESPYANVLVVKSQNQDNPNIKKVVKIYQSQAIKDFIDSKFKGAVVAAW